MTESTNHGPIEKPGSTSKQFPSIVAYNLSYYRGIKNKTQAQLAKEAGITTRTYSSLEAGTGNPTLATLSSLASRLEITVNRLLSLDLVKTSLHFQTFKKQFKEKFETHPLAASLRDLDGVIHYRNAIFRTIFPMQEDSDGKIDLVKALPENARDILLGQLASERMGLVNPYVNFGFNSQTKEKMIFRFYPCLIYGTEDSERLVAIYMTSIQGDSQSNYHQFCQKLIECL